MGGACTADADTSLDVVLNLHIIKLLATANTHMIDIMMNFLHLLHAGRITGNLKGRYHENIKFYFFALKCSLWGIK